MRRNEYCAIAMRSVALVVLLGAGWQAMAQDAKALYPRMAPVGQYLIVDRNEEIALARRAGPESVSRDADVMVLGRPGYETAIQGKNGFVCSVERSWMPANADADLRSHKCRVTL